MQTCLAKVLQEEHIVYDKLDRVVLTQDGNLRGLGADDTVLEWEYIKDYMKRKEEWESAHPPK